MADMEAVDAMTAAELRTKLAEFGLPLMPITASTRATMAKKLKMLMAAGKPNSNSRRSLAKYSSGEESDLEPPNSAPAPAPAKRNRKSMPPPAQAPPPAPAPPPTRSRRTPVKTTTDEEEDEEPATVTTRRVVHTYVSTRGDLRDGYETGSDSDVDTPAPAPPPRNYSPLPPPRPTSTTYSSATSPSNPYTASDLNSIRSRLGLSQTFIEKPTSPSYKYLSTYPSNYKSTADRDEIESPYLSNFTRKLSALKAESQERLRNPDANNGGSSSYASRSFDYHRRGDLSPDFKTAGEKNILKNNIVSLGIVGAVIVFFLGVSFMYMGMKSDVTFIIEDKNNIIPICSSNVPEHRETINCILKEKLSNSLDLLRILYPELSSRAISSKCDGGDIMPHMTENDIVNFVKKNFGNKEAKDILYDMYNLHVLVLNNPKWGVSIIKASNNVKNDISAALTSMEYVRTIRNVGQTALAILNPSIPLRCYLFQKLHSIFLLAMIIGILLALLFGIQKSIKLYLDHKKKTNDDVYSMVTQIIDVVSQDTGEDNAELNGQPMPISHVRDMLIPPKNRDKMSAIWNAAIKFIEKNESRVRFEVEVVEGEEYRSMRWVSAQGSPRVTRGSARAWQGQAFETQQGSVNNLKFSPTSCLKIRHMVDKNEKNPNQKTVIQDAILEKCKLQCKILHIEIDKVSCCVFVKCATPADAGIIYQNLHGWWYEGNLITVKYLRLERYMDHFPNSPASGPFLKPSNQ